MTSCCWLYGSALADDAEFFAAVAAEQIRGADGAAEDRGDVHQDLVADQVAVGVVDPLEVIEVEHQEAERLAMPFGEGDRVLEFGHEGCVVEHAGEAVAVDQLAMSNT